jgi:hypothetical protein
MLSKLFVVLAAGVIAMCSPQVVLSAKSKAASGSKMSFKLDRVGRQQTLEVGKRLPVVIKVDGGCSRNEKGSAKAVLSEGDGEIESDPDGEGHLVDEFIWTPRKGCHISIRLAASDQVYAWIRETGCDTDCPLSDEPMPRN